MEELKEEIITISIEQLEGLLGDEEYAKEWKAKRFMKILEENIELKRIVKVYEESEGYWSKEYVKEGEKAELYRGKYLKWKMKTKGIRKEKKGKHKEKDNRVEKVKKRKEKGCYTCGKQGHILRECRMVRECLEREYQRCEICNKKGHKEERCYKNQICERCNRRGHTVKVCKSKQKDKE